MPYKPKPYSRQKKHNKRGYRLRLYNASAVAVPRTRVIPDRYFTKLVYPAHIMMNLLGGYATHRYFRANSIYDPDEETGMGQLQPTGFDQFFQLYKRYRVTASHIRVTFIPQLNNVCFQGGIIPSSDPTDYITSPDMLSVKTNAYGKSNVITDAHPQDSIMTHYMSTEKYLGMPKGTIQFDDDLSSTMSADPDKQWYWHIVTDYSNPADTDSYQIAVALEITYYVEFFNRKELVAS